MHLPTFRRQMLMQKHKEVLDMKKYESPEMIRIEFATESILNNSIIDAENAKDPVEVGPPINIFGN